MNVWKVDSIIDEPEVILINWDVKQLPNGNRHFVGWNLLLGEGRVSSAIQEYDNEKMCGKTRSNRIYKLDGKAGDNPDAEYIWKAWCRINKIDLGSVISVSEEF